MESLPRKGTPDVETYGLLKVGKLTDVNVTDTKVDDDSFAVKNPSKRRNVGDSNQLIRVILVETSALETVGSQVELTSISDDSPSDNEKDCEQYGAAMPLDLADRLSVLQHLIPHGMELDIEEILKVAIDYVKALENEIQMFNKSKQDGIAIDSSSNQADLHVPSGVPEASVTSKASTLQKRGLCVMPLSALAKAF